MPAARNSELIETRSAGHPALFRRPRLAGWTLLALLFCAASLSGLRRGGLGAGAGRDR